MPKTKAKKQEESLRKYVFKPTITISSKDLKELKDWKVGQTYPLTIKARLVDLEMPRHEPYMMEDDSTFDKDEMKGRFEISEVKTK